MTYHEEPIDALQLLMLDTVGGYPLAGFVSGCCFAEPPPTGSVIYQSKYNVFCLIAKNKDEERLELEKAKGTLEILRDCCVKHGVKKIAITNAVKFSNELPWSELRKCIMQVFWGTDVEILVCMAEAVEVPLDSNEGNDEGVYWTLAIPVRDDGKESDEA